MRTGIPPLIRASLLVVLVLGSASRAAAQATVAGTIDATFGMVDWSFVRLAEAMPAESYAFRPTTGASPASARSASR